MTASSTSRTCLGWVWLALAGCGGTTAPPVSKPFDPASPPVMVVVQPTRNLGVIDLGKRIETFEISNTGGSDLTIKSLTKSCSCLNVKLSREQIPPGQSASLQLTIEPKQPEQRGASLLIDSDDPLSPKSRVSVDWVARGPINVEPEKLDFRVVRPGVASTIKFQIVTDMRKVKANSKSFAQATPRDLLQAQLVSNTATPEQRVETWELTLKADETSTETQGMVVLSFEGADAGDIQLLVNWELRNAVQATPRSLFLGVGGPGEKLTKSIELTSDPGVILKVSQASQLEGVIDFTANAVEVNSETTRVEIIATLPVKAGSYMGRLSVVCESPANMVVEVPVICVVRETTTEKL